MTGCQFVVARQGEIIMLWKVIPDRNMLAINTAAITPPWVRTHDGRKDSATTHSKPSGMMSTTNMSIMKAVSFPTISNIRPAAFPPNSPIVRER